MEAGPSRRCVVPETRDLTTRAGLLAAWRELRKKSGRRRHARPDRPALTREQVKERIEAKLDKTDECWLWTGRVQRGKPVLKLRGRKLNPRRLLYSLEVGAIPKGLQLWTRCRNDLCCRPDHCLPGHRSDEVERFWLKVDKSGTCWIWIGSRLPGGYGNVRFKGIMQPAHRVSYQIASGPVAEGYVRQRCKNRLCVRPEHLVLTQAIGPFGLKFKVPSVQEVADIRRAYKQADLTLDQIAAKFGVTRYHVTRIGRGTYRTGREAA